MPDFLADDAPAIAARLREIERENCSACGRSGWEWGEYSKAWVKCSKCGNPFDKERPDAV